MLKIDVCKMKGGINTILLMTGRTAVGLQVEGIAVDNFLGNVRTSRENTFVVRSLKKTGYNFVKFSSSYFNYYAYPKIIKCDNSPYTCSGYYLFIYVVDS